MTFNFLHWSKPLSISNLFELALTKESATKEILSAIYPTLNQEIKNLSNKRFIK
jgi:hypothetical protein